MNAYLLFLTFSGLTLMSLLTEKKRKLTFSRTKEEWIADILGLLIQGILVPAFPFLLVPLIAVFFPDYFQAFDLHPAFQFFLGFVVVDYLYYWNHRLFHTRSYWCLHRLHHSSRHLDIFATSRNSLITSFLFIYIWSQVASLYFLEDPTFFFLGLGVTFALDLWRHSGLGHHQGFYKLLAPVFIFPGHHVVHHSPSGRMKNFGANFSFWDKLHGTYSGTMIENENLERITKSLWKEIFTPWSNR